MSMKVLIVGPFNSPIIQRLKYFLGKQGVTVKVASFDIEDSEDTYSLGALKGFYSYLNVIKLRKVVNAFNPDVVHAHVVNHYGLMAFFCKKPVLLAAWGSDVLLSTQSSSKLKNLVFNCLNTIAVKNAVHIHTSSSNVSNKLVSDFGCPKNKISTFYWGFPLINSESEEITASRLFKEFDLKNKKNIIVFNRGLSDIYNPMKTIDIIHKLYEAGFSGQIVVFKGFASNAECVEFKSRLHPKAILIERLLNDSELYWIYNLSIAHFSIPKSDALGGGVIEPALLGSHPVLSDLSQYNEYKNENSASIFKEETSIGIIKSIIAGEFTNSTSNVPSFHYTAENITQRFISIYQKLLES